MQEHETSEQLGKCSSKPEPIKTNLPVQVAISLPRTGSSFGVLVPGGDSWSLHATSHVEYTKSWKAHYTAEYSLVLKANKNCSKLKQSTLQQLCEVSNHFDHKLVRRASWEVLVLHRGELLLHCKSRWLCTVRCSWTFQIHQGARHNIFKPSPTSTEHFLTR